MDLGFNRCIVCHQSGEILCQKCQRHLNHYTDSQHNYIWDYEHPSYLTWLIVGRHYDRIIKKLVHHLKYGGGRLVADLLGSKLATIIHTTPLIDHIQLSPTTTYVTSVPTHWIKRYFTRWYNQSELLARSIAHWLQLPYHKLLQKSKWTTSQVQITRQDRIHNIVNSFTHHQNNTTIDIIILVDDITTTWATMNECARILKQQYPQSHIRWICISRNR